MRTPIRYAGSAGSGYSRSMVVSANGKELYSVVNLPNGQRSRLNMAFYRIPLEPAVGWFYKLTAACSFKNLGVENNSDADGAYVKQWSNKEDNSQQWTLQTASDGYYKLVSKNSGKVLEVESQSTADGADIVLGQYADRDNQKWKIEYVVDGFYKLTAKHSGKCLSVSNSSGDEGANARQSAYNGSDAQKWRMDPVDTQNPWGDWQYVTGM